MPAKPMQAVSRLRPAPAPGFTLIELAIATVVLLVGILAVMKLVPAAIQANRNSRFDTTALVIAERELDQMISQPLSAGQFTDADGRAISLGAASSANPVLYGGPVVTAGSWTRIDFTAPAIAGYSFLYTDPNNPAGPVYEVRWAVVGQGINATPASKRFIVGAWKRDPTQVTLPVTLNAWVER